MTRVSKVPFFSLLVIFLLLPVASSAQEDEEVVKVETNLVSMPVVVTTRGGEYVADMRKEEFSVFEDGAEQQVAFFATITQPFHVVLLLDTSGSTEEKIGLIRQSAISFVAELQRADRVRVISFDDEVRVLNAEFTGDQAEMRRAIDSIRPGKGTRLYDAMQLAFNLLKPVKGRKAVVIFTDGVDYRSHEYNYANNIRALEESDVIVYPIRYETRAETERLARAQAEGGIDLGAILGGGGGPGSGSETRGGTTPTTVPSEERGGGIAGLPFPTVSISRPRTDRRDPRDPRYPPDPRDPVGRDASGAPMPGQRDEGRPSDPTREDSIDRLLDTLYKTADGYLEDIARVSGGRLVRADTLASLPAAFKEIAAELRTQYSIGYYPTTPVTKGGYRKIKVRTTRKGAVVRARPGYTAVKDFRR
jgi:hypothetical protein